MKDRVIVIGGTGFIGTQLIKALKAEGYAVVCLTRSPERAKSRMDLDVEFALWDGKSAVGWQHLAEGASAIVNLAGENISAGRWSEKRKERLVRSRLEAGKAVSDAVLSLEKPPGVVVQASAIGYYGSQGDLELTESSPSGEGFLSELCREWEASSRAVESAGVRHVVVRSGLVLGKQGGVLLRFVKMFRLRLGGPLGSGRQWLSWIHMDDEVSALCYLLERKNLSGVFNLTAPNPVRMREFARILGRTLSRPSWLPAPAFALKLVFGTMAEETVLSSQKVFPQRLFETGLSFEHPYLEQALMDIL